jgi:hypothetical protein
LWTALLFDQFRKLAIDADGPDAQLGAVRRNLVYFRAGLDGLIAHLASVRSKDRAGFTIVNGN